MGVDYDAYLVVGWPVEIPEDEDGESPDVDDYLSPLCSKLIGKGSGFVTEGSAYSGRENYYITMPSDTIAEIQSAIANHEAVAKKLTAAGAKLGPFCIKAVGHVW